jgi:hypothetical protein
MTTMEMIELSAEQIDFLFGLVADFVKDEPDARQRAFAEEILTALEMYPPTPATGANPHD